MNGRMGVIFILKIATRSYFEDTACFGNIKRGERRAGPNVSSSSNICLMDSEEETLYCLKSLLLLDFLKFTFIKID